MPATKDIKKPLTRMTPRQCDILEELRREDDRRSVGGLIKAQFVRPIERLYETQGGLQGMTVEQFIRAAINGLAD